MSDQQVIDSAISKTPPSRLDTVIEVLMIILLTFMPLTFGAVQAWSEMVVIALAGAMVFCLVLKLTFSPGARLIWSWVYVPIGLFLLLAVLQLIPLPAGFVKVISPNTFAQKIQLLGDLPDAAERLKSMSISFYPWATRHDLRLAVSIAAVFFVVINVYRRSEQIKRLLGAIAIIGGGVAVLALIQIISGTDKIYWLIPTGHRAADAGTFINHSNYSQFMNLSIGAALGLLIFKLYENFHGLHITLASVVEQLTDTKARSIWLLAIFIILGAASILVSLSRGGAVSLLIAASFTALVIAATRALDGRGWIIAIMALGAFVCVLYVGFDAVYERLATIRQQHQYVGRWQIVKDITVAWTRFPTVGTGLGTHEVVYPMFDRSSSPALAGHAENEYAQAAEETGIVGLALLIGLAAIVWRGYIRCVRRLHLPIRSVAFGLGFGLLAIMIHSFSDFGQHLPANATLTAVFCALLVSLARSQRANKSQTVTLATRGALRSSGALALLGLAAVWVWAIVGVNGARAAEAHWKQALRAEETLRQNGWQGSNDDYASLISNAAAAAEQQPDNVHYRHWLNVYRWQAISRVRDPDTGQVVTTPQTLEFTQRIVDELNQARLLCPTFGQTYCVAGQLEKFVLGQPIGATHIRTGYALAPCDPTACLVAGLLDIEDGKIQESLPKFQRAVSLNGGLFNETIEVYVNHANRPDLAAKLAQDDPARLLAVANRISKKSGHTELAEQIRAQAVERLRIECLSPDVTAGTLGIMANICRQEEDYESAVEYYRRALALDYGQVGWRLALAQSLAETGQVEEAMHEARICLRIRPQMEAAKKLIEELSVRKTP